MQQVHAVLPCYDGMEVPCKVVEWNVRAESGHPYSGEFMNTILVYCGTT